MLLDISSGFWRPMSPRRVIGHPQAPDVGPVDCRLGHVGAADRDCEQVHEDSEPGFFSSIELGAICDLGRLRLVLWVRSLLTWL